MKRSWIGAALLLALLAAGIATSAAMGRIHRPVAWELSQAAELAEAGLWAEAEKYSEQAWQQWEASDSFRAALADHAPVEDAESLFVQLPTYARERDAHYIAICRELARKVQAVGDAHSLTWWNVL